LRIDNYLDERLKTRDESWRNLITASKEGAIPLLALNSPYWPLLAVIYLRPQNTAQSKEGAIPLLALNSPYWPLLAVIKLRHLSSQI